MIAYFFNQKHAAMEKKRNTTTTFFTFRLGTGNFAIELSKVVKYCDFATLKSSKLSNENVLGDMVFNAYDLPVLNIRKQLGLPVLKLNPYTGVLVLKYFNGYQNVEFGIIFDGLDSLVEVSNNEILPFTKAGRKNNNKLISGIAKTDNDYYLVMDVEKLVVNNFENIHYGVDTKENVFERVTV